MSNKMWGGRFSERPDAIMEEINASIDVDRHMYAQDIAASKAHAAMLAEQGIITASDARNIAKGLDTILAEISKGGLAIFKGPMKDNKGGVVIADGTVHVQTDYTLESMNYLVAGIVGQI